MCVGGSDGGTLLCDRRDHAYLALSGKMLPLEGVGIMLSKKKKKIIILSVSHVRAPARCAQRAQLSTRAS